MKWQRWSEPPRHKRWMFSDRGSDEGGKPMFGVGAALSRATEAEGWAGARAIRKNIEAHIERLLAGDKIMSTDAIYEALVRANVPINTSDKKRRLVTILSESQQFGNVRGEGWRMTGMPRHVYVREESTPQDSESQGAA